MNEQLELMKRDGVSHLHVLSNFDRTLTKPEVDGKKIPSLISVLRDHGYLTPDYPEKAHALFDHYHQIEIDTTIRRDERKKAMKEWWTKHFELLIASGLTRQDIKNAMHARHAQLRDGTHEFFSLLKRNNIPLVIMSSSGLGVDSVHFFLEAEHELHDNIHIISNHYEWDENGKALAVKEPIIHGMNKDETLVRDFPEIYPQIQNRKNVLLLGDSTSDLDMVVGFEYQNLLSIGFLDTPDGNSGFDIEFKSSASLHKIINILSSFIN